VRKKRERFVREREDEEEEREVGEMMWMDKGWVDAGRWLFQKYLWHTTTYGGPRVSLSKFHKTIMNLRRPLNSA
jgi:hypothetical protein